MDTAWLVAGVSLALVAGSIFWILPGPADRKKMVLRKQAMALGFRVKIMHASEIIKKFGWSPGHSGLCYYYTMGSFHHIGLQYDQQADLLAISEFGGKLNILLCNLTKSRVNIDHLEKVGAHNYDGIRAIFVSKTEFGVLWNEQASERQLSQMLEELQEKFIIH